MPPENLLNTCSWDKSLAGQAVQFNYAKDLHLIQVIGHTANGVAITSTKRLANTTIIFYIGYLGQSSISVVMKDLNLTYH